MVTVLFTAPGSPPHAVAIRESCLGFAAQQRACEADLSGGTVTCVPAAAADLGLVTRDGDPAVRFRFPGTDALLTAPADGIGLAGAATIAVTRADEPLPCGLARAPCRDQIGLTACVDELFLEDGGCGTLPHPVFGHFTALPPANDFGALCTTANTPCTGEATDVRIALDRAGNLLIPMDWRRVLVRRADVPVARLLRGSILLEAFAGTGLPLRLPDDSVLGSFSVRGAPLPPILTPQRDPLAADAVALFGSADAPEGVLRVARRPTCDGGERAGLPCRTDAECAAGRCVGLFDFSTRTVAGGGPHGSSVWSRRSRTTRRRVRCPGSAGGRDRGRRGLRGPDRGRRRPPHNRFRQ